MLMQDLALQELSGNVRFFNCLPDGPDILTLLYTLETVLIYIIYPSDYYKLESRRKKWLNRKTRPRAFTG